MGMWLQHLEFAECLTDSPYFREKLNSHEKELERTSQQIKGLVKEVKELIQAARQLSRAQRTLSETLKNFDFKCIGNGQTDEEVCIQRSLLEFGRLISSIEDQRDMMLDNAYEQIIIPLDNFRKDCIGGAKEGKKRFDKQTSKFYMNQERYLNLSTKQKNNALKEADSALQMEERHFFQASLEYVLLLQEVQERKKFEFVETLMGFMYSWLTFYHQGHEVANEFKPYLKDLQHKIQKTRENFISTRDQASQLMKKKLESHDQKMESAPNKHCIREGYLFLMEKKAFGTTWNKHYCTYNKETKDLTMIPYNQITNKFNKEETIKLTSCVRRMSDSIEKRFCFDITFENENKSGPVTLTLQALSEEDRKRWMDIMDGKEPVSLDETHPPTNSHANGTYAQPGKVNRPEETTLDDIGLNFFHKCIEILESRGLEEQGLYRVGGVTSKVSKLLAMGLDRRKTISPGGVASEYTWDDPIEWDSKTVTSALKTFLRNLREPLMTFRLHANFIAAVKQESRDRRVNDVHILVYRLPIQHRSVLDTLARHLHNVASKSDKNLMTVSNLAVCFGPTLLRPEEETVAAIMDIKFCNIVVEILVENHEKIFKSPPTSDSSSPAHISIGSMHNHNQSTSSSPSSSMSLTQSGQQHAQPQQPPQINSNNIIVPPPRHIKPSAYYSSYNMQSTITPPLPVQQAVIHSFYNGPNTVLNLGPVIPNRRPNISPRSIASNISTNLQQQHNPNEFLQHARSHPILGQGNLSSTGVPSSMIRNTPHQTGIHSEEALIGSRANKHAKPVFMHGSSIPYDCISDQLNNTSSSNESVCSLNSSREYSYPQPQCPQKNKRGNSIHYASQYKPAESLLCYAVSSPISGRSSPASPGIRRVRTLYTCKGENDGELSFEPNQIITNVRRSLEPGWLEGTLNGKTGLVPENYVQFLP